MKKIWNHYNQDDITKAVALRRAKIPLGAKSKKQFNQMWLICIGIEDFVELVNKAYNRK